MEQLTEHGPKLPADPQLKHLKDVIDSFAQTHMCHTDSATAESVAMQSLLSARQSMLEHSNSTIKQGEIGLVMSATAVTKYFGIPQQDINELAQNNLCFSILTPEGSRMFPFEQFSTSGEILASAKELLDIIGKEDLLPESMQLRWLNRRREELSGFRPWDLLLLSKEELDPRLRTLAKQMMSRMSQ